VRCEWVLFVRLVDDDVSKNSFFSQTAKALGWQFLSSRHVMRVPKGKL